MSAKENYTPGMFTSHESVTDYLHSFDPTVEWDVPDEASEEILAFYAADRKRMDEEREAYNRTQKPIHPDSGEEASFIGYLPIGYPVYKTESGLYLLRRRNKYLVMTPTGPEAELSLRQTLD